jgi:hypothetical protein
MFFGWLAPSYAQQPERSSLPIPDTQYKYPGKVPLDARDAKFPSSLVPSGKRSQQLSH